MKDREKEEKRDKAFDGLKKLTNKTNKVRKVLQSLESRTKDLREYFDVLDREIAMKNRTIISSRKVPIVKEAKSFTLDEIKSIAVKLGVEITIKEKDEK